MIRGGRVLGSRTFFPRAVAGTMAGEVLAAFICSTICAAAPAEILVSSALERPRC